MGYRPEVKFISDTISILKSKKIVSDFVSFLEKNGYEYYYPFTTNASDQDVADQIEEDINSFQLQQAHETLEKEWSTFSFDTTSSEAMSVYLGDYNCVLTMYGPRGYFYTPNTIYVNISFGTEQEWIQTLLHELLHLVHFEETKNFTHAERERFIDEKFIELWGNAFPGYSKQNFIEGDDVIK